MKKLWFQLHWLVGITAGTVLIVIGLTGAILAFRDELLDVLNPGVTSVAVRQAPVLAPPQLAEAVRRAHPGARITSIVLDAEPGSTARVGLAPAPGAQHGETVFVDPYSGAMLPPLHYDEVFEWVESLHRHLLLPRDDGRPVAGALAVCLMGLALSGLYLRWPRRALDWRTWLTFDTRLKGRSFLWGLHSVAGTWALLAYLLFTVSGVYWSYDVVRDTVDGWAGVRRPPRVAAAPKPAGAKRVGAPAEAADLALAWSTFQRQAPGWRTVSLRPPERATQPLQVLWVASDAPHIRARGRMSINQQTGAIVKNEPYVQMGVGARALTTLYPLHMGTYFGLPGRLFMFCASLALPGFAVTGWMLYLKRRRQKRAAQAERARLAEAGRIDSADPVLMAYASQTGSAERLALQSAAVLQQAGVAVHVQSLEKLTPPLLGSYRRVLFVASSFGEGEPPDTARRFSRLLHVAAGELAHLQYAVLALGDRHYLQFCGFGQTLDRRLRVLGAQPLHPIIEVDNGDAGALARWSQALRELAGIGDDAPSAELSAAAPDSGYTSCHLARRELLNPGSAGGELYEITLTGGDGASWRPGALLDVWPGHYAPGQSARRYSLASLPQDGCIQLLVRQARGEQGMGLASGWLTVQAAPGDEVRIRLVDNPSFDMHDCAQPAVYIGNGSGMAGLRSHLRARVAGGQRRNWLVFGERQREFDSICAAEIDGWRESGHLPELDLVYSRDADGQYVQDRLRAKADQVRSWIADGAVIYVCGSLQGMAGGVDAALEDIIGSAALDELRETGRYRRDVY
ncbi:sulfite reductase flavoprotein subunit alpha [Duganella sp. HH101]|uniref:PepSY domain-containing protein n=1 Tax=Duganella sp. HH101 TaxID=1781066 RepID=UPI00087535FA|nr:sulfite reductase flavoprotein subunit alpha [Duganella sp. HH101]OFA05850.1 sulfite reductase [NADPH] flavoprotein alpha-component [Duganella sp. HH101]